jgi:hypothetical protein
MTKLTLDRTREFGTVHGEPSFVTGIDPDTDAEIKVVQVYDQDGFPFDAAGNLIEDLLTPALRKKLERVLAQNLARETAQKAYLEALGEHATPADAKSISFVDPNAPQAIEVDLVAWANGSKKYRFDLVVKKIREMFDISPGNRKQCLEVLKANGVIQSDGGGQSQIDHLTGAGK